MLKIFLSSINYEILSERFTLNYKIITSLQITLYGVLSFDLYLSVMQAIQMFPDKIESQSV